MDRLSTSQDGKVSLPCLLAGDFNLTPDSPVYSFLVQGDLKFAGLNSKNLQTFGHGSRLKNVLFPPELGVTDSCQVCCWSWQVWENFIFDPYPHSISKLWCKDIQPPLQPSQPHSLVMERTVCVILSQSQSKIVLVTFMRNVFDHYFRCPNSFLSDQLKEAMTNSKHSGSGVLSHGLNLRSVLLPHSQSVRWWCIKKDRLKPIWSRFRAQLFMMINGWWRTTFFIPRFIPRGLKLVWKATWSFFPDYVWPQNTKIMRWGRYQTKFALPITFQLWPSFLSREGQPIESNKRELYFEIKIFKNVYRLFGF